MMGTARRLHEASRAIRCIAVEPSEPMHGLEGLKHMATSLVPAIYDRTAHDEVFPVSTEDGWDMADMLAAREGLHVGHSSGANIHAAVKLAERALAEGREACIVAILPDRGDRYFAPMKWEKRYVW